jgi:SMI1 / KNR4 family (SUKH-1)
MKDLHRALELARLVAGIQRVDLPPGIGDAEIDALGRRIGAEIPEELRRWLRVCNAPLIGPGGIYGVCPDNPFLDIESRLHLHPEWLSLGWLPIAGDGCGSYYMLELNHQHDHTSPVSFVDERDYHTALYCVASGYCSFIGLYLREEFGDDFWPFDKERILLEDPELAHIHWLPLPWDV